MSLSQMIKPMIRKRNRDMWLIKAESGVGSGISKGSNQTSSQIQESCSKENTFLGSSP